MIQASRMVATKPGQSKWIRVLLHGLSGFRRFASNPRVFVGVTIFALFVLMAVFAPVLVPYDPQASTGLPMAPPSAAHWFGTTNTGQDIFSQFIVGSRITLLVGVGSGLASTAIAVVLGLYAGYKGRWIDSIINTVTNVFLVLPALALLIIIEGLMHSTNPLLNASVITITGWAYGARVFRSQVLSLANRDFVVAAKLSGASSLRIMFVEILPNMWSVVASSVMYACLAGILAESGLAFLGFEDLTTTSLGGHALLGGCRRRYAKRRMVVVSASGTCHCSCRHEFCFDELRDRSDYQSASA